MRIKGVRNNSYCPWFFLTNQGKICMITKNQLILRTFQTFMLNFVKTFNLIYP
ncbi:hypothetical protein HMPREF0670_00627 [Prevotella sp. oral taxon 317 str. F0108]|nr:hypothetical protein HMPREF0670_00627 [Prevotella sp. oral taxon 317 str. F0108]